jgi:glycosyltransferase involved in cell wall biosynthesis
VPIERIPFLILGDAPDLPTGLGRIGRDLAYGLAADQASLGIDIAYLGLHYMGTRFPFHCSRVTDIENWGRWDIHELWERLWGREPGIIFAVYDPARLWGAWEQAPLGSELWAYMAVDAATPDDSFSRALAEVLSNVHRPLAYGRWASRLMKTVLPEKPIAWLPHGLDLSTWKPNPAFREGRTLVGAVGANQPRKDWNLVFETFAMLRESDPSLLFWAHIDTDVRHWSIPELARLYKLDDPELLHLTHVPLQDEELANLYSQCLVTVGMGRGEGFGYPGVESLACGTPYVAVDYAGGAELIPQPQWRVPYEAWTVESPHCLVRPVLEPAAFAEAALGAIAWMREEPLVAQAFCAGTVAHLDWQSLWPRWRSWFKRGVAEFRVHLAEKSATMAAEVAAVESPKEEEPPIAEPPTPA